MNSIISILNSILRTIQCENYTVQSFFINYCIFYATIILYLKLNRGGSIMNELKFEELQGINGGDFGAALGIGVAAWTIATEAYDFYRGVKDGLK